MIGPWSCGGGLVVGPPRCCWAGAGGGGGGGGGRGSSSSCFCFSLSRLCPSLLSLHSRPSRIPVIGSITVYNVDDETVDGKSDGNNMTLVEILLGIIEGRKTYFLCFNFIVFCLKKNVSNSNLKEI